MADKSKGSKAKKSSSKAKKDAVAKAADKVKQTKKKIVDRKRKHAFNQAMTPEPRKDNLVDIIKSDIKRYSEREELNSKEKADSKQALNPLSASKNALAGTLNVIYPTFDADRLISVINLTDTGRQCIDAWITNVVGNGWTIERVSEEPEDAENISPEEQKILDKKEYYSDILDTPNPAMTGQEYLKAIAKDKGYLGRAYTEISRTADNDNEISCLYHIPANTMFKTEFLEEAVEVDTTMRRRGEDITVTMDRHFRRFVQKPDNRVKDIYFKELGDPSSVSLGTGNNIQDILDEDGNPIPFTREELANEVAELADYEPGHVYALPCYINQLTKMLAGKLVDDVNLDYFMNNMVPAFVVAVSGGQVTEETLERIEKRFKDKQGLSSMNEMLFLEVLGDFDSGSDTGTIAKPEVKFHNLQDERQTDAVFREFKKDIAHSVLSAFRMGPIVLGLSNDYTESTARVAMLMAESQVFGPARKEIEAYINKILFVDPETGMRCRDWKFKLNPTRVFNEEGVTDAVKLGIESGAYTPNDVIKIFNSHLSLDIAPVTDAWGNAPGNTVKDIFANYLAGIQGSISIPSLDALVVQGENNSGEEV